MPAKKVMEEEKDEEEYSKIKGALVDLGNMIKSLENKMDASVSVLGGIGESIGKSLERINKAIFEYEEENEPEKDTREAILDELKRGEITVDEAEERLDAIESGESSGKDSVPIRKKKGKKKKSSKSKSKKGFGGGCTDLGDFAPDQLCNKIGSLFGEEEEDEEGEEE